MAVLKPPEKTWTPAARCQVSAGRRADGPARPWATVFISGPLPPEASWETEFVDPFALEDGVIRLRRWSSDDAAWYAESVRDPEIQRFTTDSPTLDAEQVRVAIVRLRNADDAEGFVICDAVTGMRLGNIAALQDDRVGEVSYWLAAQARGRGAATRALTLFSSWLFTNAGLTELRLRAHRDNTASQKSAMRAGYRRDPDRDGPQEAKGTVWPMLAFNRVVG